MTAAVLVVALVGALVAGALAVATQRGPGALAGLAVALAGVALAYEAPGLGWIALAAIGGAALVVRVAWNGAGEAVPEVGPAPGKARPAAIAAVPSRTGSPSRFALVSLALAGLSFVLIGTWARQFVWAGRELLPGAGFGGAPALAGALAGAPGLLGIGLVIVVAVAACAGAPRHRI